jgi:hypothetical protein
MAKDLKRSFMAKFNDTEIKSVKNESPFSVDFSFLDLSFIENFEDENKVEIERITKNIYSISQKGAIEKGNEYNKAFELFTKDGNYEKWLKYINVDKKTALRQRKRATLYNVVVSEKDKQIIASIPQKLIDKIFDERNLLEDLSNIQSIKTEEIEEKEEKEEIEILDFDFSEEVENIFSEITEITEIIDEVDEKDKIKLHKLMNEMKKISQKYIKD